jgi:DNA polymerase-3 subunit delta
VRTALDIAQGLDRGEPPAQIKRRLRMPSRAADRLIADARSSGSAQLQHALEQIADLELASRGGGSGATSEDTAAVRAIQEIAG